AATERDAACAARLRADGLEAFMDFWEQLPLFASQRDLPPDVRERLRAGRMANDAEALARTFEQAGQHVMPSRAETLETLDVLRAGDTPLLYLAGERDEKYRALAAQAAEAGATVRIIPGAGHNAHLEAPATFAKEVASFLRK
ncbi:alpha/beta fold hydrolase, partial [Eggerthella sp. 1_3_56FAA]